LSSSDRFPRTLFCKEGKRPLGSRDYKVSGV
jgi:hypothetical protein